MISKEFSLLLFSGGLDSTAVLLWLLKNSKENIHVHHIFLQNSENRAEAEKISVNKILNYCKLNYDRPFTYTRSVWKMPEEAFVPFDLYVYMFTAAMIARGYKGRNILKKVVTGSIKENIKTEIRRKQAWGIFKSSCAGRPDLEKVEWFTPLSEMTKKEVYAYLPKELSELTWSCRRPIYNNDKILKCGICVACKELEKIQGN